MARNTSSRTSPSPKTVRCVIFDGDDTLWITEPLYDVARSRARKIVRLARLDDRRWEEIERALDVANVKTYGHSSTRFPTSWRQAYEAVCHEAGTEISPEVAQRIEEAARSVFLARPKMASRAKAMLRLLKSKGYRLGLLTKGDPHVQQKRIAESNLANFFDAISIVNLKSRDSFRDVVDQLGGTPLSTWSIGNSLKSDILPALSAGLRAIWLDAHVWEYERDHTCVPPSEVVRAAALSEAIDAILSRKHAPNPSQHGASSPAGEPC